MRYTSSHGAAASPSFSLNPNYKSLTMKNTFDTTNTESQKVIAERINGWAAMMGFWAVVGAYLTTGQIIPGLV